MDLQTKLWCIGVILNLLKGGTANLFFFCSSTISCHDHGRWGPSGCSWKTKDTPPIALKVYSACNKRFLWIWIDECFCSIFFFSELKFSLFRFDYASVWEVVSVCLSGVTFERQMWPFLKEKKSSNDIKINATMRDDEVDESDVPSADLFTRNTRFLDATTHLFKRSCPSVGPSVGPSVRRSVCPALFSNDEYDRFWG